MRWVICLCEKSDSWRKTKDGGGVIEEGAGEKRIEIRPKKRGKEYFTREQCFVYYQKKGGKALLSNLERCNKKLTSGGLKTYPGSGGWK